ncbi:MAG: prepilin-type N-terminal cleavage/methylation domain-containing protein [Betaproteobacteria bacterium]|nr:prepilin-type N-terminal cleavage/methylation domain-containing protein [Betaproteobacteria bacterium]
MKCAEALVDPRTAVRRARGFTLIELMIVIAVLGAIIAAAIPSYRQYNMRANRSAAAQVMLNVQNREEAYLLDARAYTDVLGPSGLNIIQDGWTCSNTPATGCSNNFYTVTVAVVTGTPPTYTVTATPIAGKYQVDDGNLTLTSSGTRSRSAGDGKW